ncbi:MAG: hypothetical protein JSV17_16360 [Candidatus Aminicenantes bacterium]|nr:MAG: hypothetical protein JSV17_16360 [Candidatus Aminicenantes bacterium]
MKKLWFMLVCGIFCFVLFADVKNADKPLEGEWDFRPQKVWEIDNVNDAPFERPSELRASQDEKFYFHDFDRAVSYVYDSEGKFIKSFAKQGTGPGEVNRYLNCFLAGDKVVIGSPDKLHFFSEEGSFLKSTPNNLFERFPLFFVNEDEFLYSSRIVNNSTEIKDKIIRSNLKTGKESVFDELTMTPGEKQTKGGMSLVVLGLTPQIKIGYDNDSQKFYYGRSDDYTIYISDARGRKLSSFHLDRERRTVTNENKRKHFEKSSIPEDRIDAIIPTLPDELTYFMRIQVVKGLIFVYSTESLDMKQDKIALDIFSPEGKYLYRSHLQFGDETPLYTHVEKVIILENHCYAILEDESGKSFFAKYKISLPRTR